MSTLEMESLTPIGAQLGKVRAISVTTSSARHNLAALTELSAAVDRGAILRLRADGDDVYYAFNTADSGSIDETNTTASNATQCDMIPAGDFIDVRCPRIADTLATWLLVKGPTACRLRISISSENPIAGR